MKILQIMPADGWYAQYETAPGKTTRVSLVCWALVNICDDTEVRGMEREEKTAALLISPSRTGFHHYAKKDSTP